MEFTVGEMYFLKMLVNSYANEMKRGAQEFVDELLERGKVRKQYKDETEFLKHRNKQWQERLANSKNYQTICSLRAKIENCPIDITVVDDGCDEEIVKELQNG